MILEEDKEGIVWDGPSTSVSGDIDTQTDHTTVTFHFSGFKSALHGISQYEWALGTVPKLDDAKPYTEEGIITSEGPGRGNYKFSVLTKI